MGDAATIALSFFTAHWLRFHSGLVSVPKGIPPIEPYVAVFPAVLAVFLYIFKTSHLYQKRERFSLSSEIGKVARAVSLSIFILMALSFLFRGSVPFSRAFVLMAWGISILFLSVERGISNQMELGLRRRRKEGRRVILIGTGDASRRLIRGIEANPRLEYEVAGVVSLQPEKDGQFLGKPILGGLGDLSQILLQTNADEVILTAAGLEHKQMMQIILECEKNMVGFRLVPDMFEIITSQVNVTQIAGVPLLGLKEIPLANLWNRFVKRAFDIVGAAAGLLATSPLLFLTTLLIKLDSRGPVFYKQERCGEDGRVFTLYKFRTMKVDAEKETGPVWAAEEDPRRTRVGKWLRRWNWDELPQLWNVLRGDMSLVGPRPERPHFVNQFKENVPRYMSRHLIRSGITGWSQVNGLRGQTEIRERIKFDLFYIENWSLLFDIKILLLTFLRGNQNAY